jgi:hypothetical protein
MSYGGNSRRVVVPVGGATQAKGEWPKRADGTPDFANMTSAQRLAYDAVRLQRRFG